MTEAEVERYFTWAVRRAGGQTYKFRSPTHSGVADRIACLPNGETWFIEIKKIGGRISPLQHMFAEDMHRLHQNYACLWSKEEIDQWLP